MMYRILIQRYYIYILTLCTRFNLSRTHFFVHMITSMEQSIFTLYLLFKKNMYNKISMNNKMYMIEPMEFLVTCDTPRLLHCSFYGC